MSTYCSFSSFVFRSTGPIAVARRQSVGRSVGRSVCLFVNTSYMATNVRIFLNLVGILQTFYSFCKFKILNFVNYFFNLKKI